MQAGLPVAEYTALQVKQAVVGHGKAAKEQVQEMVKAAIAAFARGFSPLVCVEFARRSIPAETRPEFTEMETHVKEKS